MKRTIGLLSRVLDDLKIECRIFGSVIPAAILGRPQRKLGDIDLMINLNDRDKLCQRLENEDYQTKVRRFEFLGLILVCIEAIKKGFLDLTIFLGEFDKKKNFVIRLSKNFKLVVHHQAIKPTAYQLHGVRFIGIPAETGYYGAWVSRGNPKRKYDLAVFEQEKIPRPAKNYPVIDFYYRHKKLPFLYPLSCFLQDLLGRASFFFGGDYDFWRR